jgi:hypothetical protein
MIVFSWMPKHIQLQRWIFVTSVQGHECGKNLILLNMCFLNKVCWFEKNKLG